MKLHNKSFIIFLLFILLFSGCGTKENIKIGFSGTLTGSFSFAGKKAHNGIILAVEQINTSGGIDGRRIELLSMDDKNTEKTALAADKYLIDQGVFAIIGHITSSMTVKAASQANKEKIALLSPTAGSILISGKDDYIIRTASAISASPTALARNAYTKSNIKTIYAVYNLHNRAYTENFFKSFKKEFEKHGGKIINTRTFNSNENVSYSQIAEKITADRPEGALILSDPREIAIISQQLRKINKEIVLFSNGMSKE